MHWCRLAGRTSRLLSTVACSTFSVSCASICPANTIATTPGLQVLAHEVHNSSEERRRALVSRMQGAQAESATVTLAWLRRRETDLS